MQTGEDPAGQRVVVFDFDGVLVRGDTFGMFMRDRYAHDGWRKALALLATPWLVLVVVFSRKRALRALVHVGLLGIDGARYRTLAGEFAIAMVHRPRRFFRDGLRTLRRHQSAGDRIVVVTGCEEALARAVLAGLGLGGIEVLGSRLREGPLGMRSAWHNVGRHKVESLAQHGIHSWRVAYSDSGHDLPMLAGAVEPVMVNATPGLCKRVESALGRSVTRAEWT